MNRYTIMVEFRATFAIDAEDAETAEEIAYTFDAVPIDIEPLEMSIIEIEPTPGEEEDE